MLRSYPKLGCPDISTGMDPGGELRRGAVPAEAGLHANHLFKRQKWIPAFAGITLRPDSCEQFGKPYSAGR